LWSGILGEVGAREVAWDLEHGAQAHGLYQQLLRSLGESGVLLAVASKNDPALVDEALARDDLVLRRDALFPIEAHWQAKSLSLTRVLAAWNVAAEDVVLVDDSAMELAEVAAVHPGVTGLRFPKGGDAAVLALLRELRELFAASEISETDRVRA